MKQTVSSYGESVTRTATGLLRKQFLGKFLPSMEATAEFGMVISEFNHPRKVQIIADCVELMELSINEALDTIKALANLPKKSPVKGVLDAQLINTKTKKTLPCMSIFVFPPESSNLHTVQAREWWLGVWPPEKSEVVDSGESEITVNHLFDDATVVVMPYGTNGSTAKLRHKKIS
nr:hypothetical protein Iba_chr02aCG12390 [Ipomoea batatas]